MANDIPRRTTYGRPQARARTDTCLLSCRIRGPLTRRRRCTTSARSFRQRQLRSRKKNVCGQEPLKLPYLSLHLQGGPSRRHPPYSHRHFDCGNAICGNARIGHAPRSSPRQLLQDRCRRCCWHGDWQLLNQLHLFQREATRRRSRTPCRDCGCASSENADDLFY